MKVSLCDKDEYEFHVDAWLDFLTTSWRNSRSDCISKADQNLKLLKPSWRPPNAIFGPVWTIVYLLMGIASYLVARDGEGFVRTLALTFYFIQLLLNWAWSPTFFVLHQIGAALVTILLLFINIFICILQFWNINSCAGMLLIPYFIWVGFASALNMSIWQLNSPYAQPPPRRTRPQSDPYQR